jgi:hypothetical protein
MPTTASGSPGPTSGGPPVGETVKQVAQRGAGEAKQLTSEALDSARQLVRNGSTEVRGQLQQQTTRAAEAARTASSQLLALARGDTQNGERAQALVQSIGSRLQEVAERLDTEGFDGVARQTSDFARRRPMVFLGGMALAGFVAGRYAKVLMDRSDDSSPEHPFAPGGNGHRRPEPLMGGPAAVDPAFPADPMIGGTTVGTDPSGAGYGVSTAPPSSFPAPGTTSTGFDAPPTGGNR